MIKRMMWFFIGFVTAWVIFDPANFGNTLQSISNSTAEFGRGFADGSPPSPKR